MVMNTRDHSHSDDTGGWYSKNGQKAKINTSNVRQGSNKKPDQCLQLKTSLSKLSKLSKEHARRHLDSDPDRKRNKSPGTSMLKNLYMMNTQHSIGFNNKFSKHGPETNKNNDYSSRNLLNGKKTISPILFEIMNKQSTLNNSGISIIQSIRPNLSKNIQRMEENDSFVELGQTEPHKDPKYDFMSPKLYSPFSAASPTTTLIYSDVEEFYEPFSLPTFQEKSKPQGNHNHINYGSNFTQHFEAIALLNRIKVLEEEVECIRISGNLLLNSVTNLDSSIQEKLLQETSSDYNNDSADSNDIDSYLDNDYFRVSNRHLERKVDELSRKLRTYKTIIKKFSSHPNRTHKNSAFGRAGQSKQRCHRNLEKVTDEELNLIENCSSSDSEINADLNTHFINEIQDHDEPSKHFEMSFEKDRNKTFFNNIQKTGFNVKLTIKK